MVRGQGARSRGERRAITLAIRDGGQEIDPGKALERGRYRHQLRLGKWIGGSAAKRKSPDAGGLRGMGDHDHAVGHDGVIGGIGAVPFQHRELGVMRRAALAVAVDMRQLPNPV